MPFGHGAAAVRCLDREFQHSGARSKVAATAELLHLAPAGSSAAALDSFLTRYRSLLAAAGVDNVGPAAQADVLQRAAVGHPVLGPVVAAWRHAGDHDPAVLLERLEDAVAEGRHAPVGGRGAAKAWAAVVERSSVGGCGAGAACCCHTHHSTSAVAPSSSQQHGWASDSRATRAMAAQPQRQGGAPAAESSSDPRKCFGCGKTGHIRRNCPYRGAAHKDSNTELLAAVRELAELLRSKK